MDNLKLIIIAIILTESITEIITKSKIFSPLREWFFNRRAKKIFKFTHDLFDCAYCMSVWIGTLVGICLIDIEIVSPIIDWFIIGILLHRSSNLLHNLMDRTRKDDF